HEQKVTSEYKCAVIVYKLEAGLPKLDHSVRLGRTRRSVMASEGEDLAPCFDDVARSGVMKEPHKSDQHGPSEQIRRCKRPAWTAVEECILAEKHAIHGNAWILISKSLPGRSAAEVKNVYQRNLRAPKGLSHPSLLRSYVQAVQGHEEDDAARKRVYTAVLKAHEEELGSEAGAAAAAAAARPLLGNPLVGTQAVIGMLAGLPMQLQPLGLNLQSERLSPQDQLRLVLLQHHHLNLQQLKQKQQEQKQQQQQEFRQQHGETGQEQHRQQHAHGIQQLSMLAHGTGEDTGVPKWQRVFQPPGVKPVDTVNPELAAAASAPAVAAVAALARVSATVSPGVPAGSVGGNVTVNGTCSVQGAPGEQPAPNPQPLFNSMVATSVGRLAEHDRPDKTRAEEARVGNGQIGIAEAWGAIRSAAPCPASHSGDQCNVGVTVETQQQTQLLRSAAPPSPQALASIANRKRPLGTAAEVPSAKHPKRRPLPIARINQLRREGLFESDGGELDSPQQKLLGRAGSPDGKDLPPVAEARRLEVRQAQGQDERQEQHRAWERRSTREKQQQQDLLPQQKHKLPRFSLLPGQRKEQPSPPLMPHDRVHQPGQEPSSRGQQWQLQDVEEGDVPLDSHLLEERVLQQQPDAGRELKGDVGPPQPPITSLGRKSKRKAAALAPAAWGRAVEQGRQGAVGGVAKGDDEEGEQEDEEEGAARGWDGKDEEELMRQEAEMFGEEDDWQNEEMPGLDGLGRVSLMPAAGRKRRRRVAPDIASMLDTLDMGLPPIDPPMVLLRRPDGGPPILCVAVPLGTLKNHGDHAALDNLPVGDLPPGSNLAVDFFEDINAAAARGMCPQSMGEEYLPRQPRGAYANHLTPARGPGREAPDRGQGFEALAAAAAAAAAMVGLPPAGRRGSPGDVKEAGSSRGRGPGSWVAADSGRGGAKSMRRTRGRAGPARSRDGRGAVGNPELAAEGIVAPATGAIGAGTSRESYGGPRAVQDSSWRQETARGGGPQRGVVRGVMEAERAEGDVNDAEAAPVTVKEPEVREPPRTLAPRDPRRRLLSPGGGLMDAAGDGGGKRSVVGSGGGPAADRVTTETAVAGVRSDAEREDEGAPADYPDPEGTFLPLQLPVPTAPFSPGGRLFGHFMGPVTGQYAGQDLFEGGDGGNAGYADEDVTAIRERAYEDLLGTFPRSVRRGGAARSSLEPSMSGRGDSGGAGNSGSMLAAWAAVSAGARRGGSQFPSQQMPRQALYGKQMKYLMAQMAREAGRQTLLSEWSPPPPSKVRKGQKQWQSFNATANRDREQELGLKRRVSGPVPKPAPECSPGPEAEPEPEVEEEATAEDEVAITAEGSNGGAPLPPSSRPGAPLTSRSGRKIIRRYDDAMEYEK
ncbi:hypothetical protein VaNZ11_014561, partial [Volvox africanus]